MTALRLESISKHFGAIHALNDVSMSLAPGEVVGLMGDNGAGKSTLVKIIAGNYRPTQRQDLHQGPRDDLPPARWRRARTASRSSTRTWRYATI